MPALKEFHAQPVGSMVCGAYTLAGILDAFGLGDRKSLSRDWGAG